MRNNFKAFIIFVCITALVAAYFFAQRTFFNSVKEASINSPTGIQNLIFPKTQKVTLIFTGDVMLGRTVERTAKAVNDTRYPFLKVADTLQSADITLINLENPIISNCLPHDSGFIFCANPEMVEGLVYAGVDIVTLANNHTLNHGQKGIDSTVSFLQQKNISSTGLGNLIVTEKAGIRFGFLGFEKSQQSNPKLTASEKSLIQESDKRVDVLIVAMHWGVEYQNKALPGVRTLAKEIVANGADVIVGSHPHWVQDSEYVGSPDGKSKPVYYSLGNFVFDQMWSEPTREGLAVRLTFNGKDIQKEELLPVYSRNRGQPEFINEDN